VVAGIFAGSDDGAECDCSSHRSILVQDASPHRFGEANRLPVSAAHRSALAKLECDFSLLLVRLKSRCFLLPRRLVHAGRLAAAFDMPCNLPPAPQSMRRPFAGHNESALRFLSGVPRSKPL